MLNLSVSEIISFLLHLKVMSPITEQKGLSGKTLRYPNDVSAARKKLPSHERFGDFIRNRMAGEVMENLFYQLVTKLKERGHISYANLFVDGTKIEASANRYSFVWEKSVSKNEAKMDAQIQMKLLELQTEYGFFETPPTLEGMLEYHPSSTSPSSSMANFIRSLKRTACL